MTGENKAYFHAVHAVVHRKPCAPYAPVELMRQWGLIEASHGRQDEPAGFIPALSYTTERQGKPGLTIRCCQKPIEDLAAAIRLIGDRAADFGVEKEELCIGLFCRGTPGCSGGRLIMAYQIWTQRALLCCWVIPAFHRYLFFDAAEEAKQKWTGGGCILSQAVGRPESFRESP